MKYLGLKLTHDASLSIFDDNRLIRCIEFEKIGNNKRYKECESLEEIALILKTNGLELVDFDQVLIDGWEGAKESRVTLDDGLEFDLAPYAELGSKDNPLKSHHFRNEAFEYQSFYHVANHVTAAYMSSPFGAKSEPAYVIVWDGGCYPRLYFVDPKARTVRYIKNLFRIFGNIYGLFAQYFPPYNSGEPDLNDLSIAGKVMAYIAFGNDDKQLHPDIDECHRDTFEPTRSSTLNFTKAVADKFKLNDVTPANAMATMHGYLQARLVEAVEKDIMRKGNRPNVIFTGGCALNIKWNSSLRNIVGNERFWVPPFPNDSGASIGAVCTFLFLRGCNHIEWSVYSGPDLVAPKTTYKGWSQREISTLELADILYTTKDPVVVLNGPAELGPRALGNRSILADPTSSDQKSVLNHIKRREYYRPVAPIALERSSTDFFIPGNSDPYMLFDHEVVGSMQSKIPAILHLDGTARLQSVSETGNPFLLELLSEFEKISGVGVLCNTSANYNGSGFFPDVDSAIEWGGCRYIFSEGILYTRNE